MSAVVEAAPSTRPRILSTRRLVLIGAVALVVRVGYVAAVMRDYRPNSDADSYFHIGRAVSQGRGYVFTLPFEFLHATAIRPPLYPTVIAAAFKVFGVHVGVAQGVNVVAGSAVAVLGGLIGARIGGPRAGLCAGLVVALYPPLIANDVTTLAETMAGLLLFATVLLLLDGHTVFAGAALGLLMLDRASAQWFAVVVGAWVVWRFGWAHALRMAAVALLVVAPWVVRNAVNVGGPTLVATNGFNLNAIYSDEAHATPGEFVDAYFDPRFAPMRAVALDEVDLDGALRRNALHDLREHPDRLVHVAQSNVERWLELRPSLNRVAERRDGRNLDVRDWTLPGFYLVTAAGIVALVLARRSAAAQLLLLTSGYFTLVCLVSVSVPRLRSVFDACMAVGAGAVLAWLIDRRVHVDQARPPVRPIRVAESAVVIGGIAVVIAASGLVWRMNTQDRAANAIRAAATRDASALGALANDYRTAQTANRPPRFERADLHRARDLAVVLEQRTPQVGSDVRTEAADALRTTRVAAHELEVVSLLSAGEYLRPSNQQTPSLAAVRSRYEREIRPKEPSLEAFDLVMTGEPLERAERAIAVLRRDK